MNALRFEQESKTGPENANFGVILRICERLKWSLHMRSERPPYGIGYFPL